MFALEHRKNTLLNCLKDILGYDQMLDLEKTLPVVNN